MKLLPTRLKIDAPAFVCLIRHMCLVVGYCLEALSSSDYYAVLFTYSRNFCTAYALERDCNLAVKLIGILFFVMHCISINSCFVSVNVLCDCVRFGTGTEEQVYSKGSSVTFVRTVMVSEQRMRPDHWLELVLFCCVWTLVVTWWWGCKFSGNLILGENFRKLISGFQKS